jgi:hypothetical protein
MANTARLVIYVRSARGSSTVQISSKGRYISLPVNTINIYAPGQPLYPTASQNAFWFAVLDAVETLMGSPT